MFTKFTLIIVSLVLMVSLVGCGAKNSTTPIPSPSESNPAPSQEASSTEGEYSYNYQMLPMISGKVANVTLDANADGTTQQLKMGEVMAIILESNPSTGYSWTATISSPSVLVQMGEPQYQEPAAASGTPLVGAAGTQTFYFEAAGSGTTTLTLDYLRSFETNVAPEKTVVITIEVK
jgi:predicted secreted protein